MPDQRTPLRDALMANLSQVLVSNGWNTDIGRNGFVGIRQVQDTDCPCFVLQMGDEQRGVGAQNNQHVDIQVTVTGYLSLGTYTNVEADTKGNEILQDIKETVGDICAYADVAQQIEYRRGSVYFPEKAGPVVAAAAAYIITTPRITTDLSK